MRHVDSVLMEGNIAAVMQAGFDLPLLAFQAQKLFWAGLLARKTGEAKMDHLFNPDDLAIAQKIEFTFQAEYLSSKGPVEIGILHTADGRDAFFNPSVIFIDRLGSLKIQSHSRLYSNTVPF
jgi:hypothetical protein